MSAILAILEQRNGVIRKGAAELLAAARRLADQCGGTVDALICSAAPISADSLGAAGADRVLRAIHPDFDHYSPDGITAAAASLAHGYCAILTAATAAGKDLAPRIAARIGSPCGMDVTAADLVNGRIQAVRPIYAGKVLQTVVYTGTPVLAVRPGAYPAVAAGKAGSIIDATVPEFTNRLRVQPVKAAESTAVDITEARVIVAGGRGLGDPSRFDLLRDLAGAFGGDAAVGASRAVVDAGWIGHETQVGQTGKTVAPELYIAVGVSGAIQHLAGMRTSKVIVAINRDKDAPIFKVADYGIVGDLFEVLPVLTAAIKAARS